MPGQPQCSQRCKFRSPLSVSLQSPATTLGCFPANLPIKWDHWRAKSAQKMLNAEDFGKGPRQPWINFLQLCCCCWSCGLHLPEAKQTLKLLMHILWLRCCLYDWDTKTDLMAGGHHHHSRKSRAVPASRYKDSLVAWPGPQLSLTNAQAAKPWSGPIEIFMVFKWVITAASCIQKQGNQDSQWVGTAKGLVHLSTLQHPASHQAGEATAEQCRSTSSGSFSTSAPTPTTYSCWT